MTNILTPPTRIKLPIIIEMIRYEVGQGAAGFVKKLAMILLLESMVIVTDCLLVRWISPFQCLKRYPKSGIAVTVTIAPFS